MIFKGFVINVILRIVLLIAAIILLAYVVVTRDWVFSVIVLLIIISSLVMEMVRYVTKTNQELSRLLSALKHSDYSVRFTDMHLGSGFRELHESFQEIADSYRKTRIEKEAQYQYFRLLLEQLDIGVISVDDNGTITLMNEAAELILQSPDTRKWALFKNTAFAKEANRMRNGESTLIELQDGDEPQYLSVHLHTIRMTGKLFKVYTFKNIRSEIERKEIEAWHKLIRILTHEIMNSVTPISSLSESLAALVSRQDGEPMKAGEMGQEELQDVLMGLKTIQRRSSGLLHFVADYRKLSKVPEPMKEPVKLHELLERIVDLMRNELEKDGIRLLLGGMSRQLEVVVDAGLIEQVVINLILNSKDALEGESNAQIELLASVEGALTSVHIIDNGSGVARSDIEKIFVPFYSTKESGSGIGLSLSKHIMKLHNGTIRVQSQPGVKTTFSLVFQN